MKSENVHQLIGSPWYLTPRLRGDRATARKKVAYRRPQPRLIVNDRLPADVGSGRYFRFWPGGDGDARRQIARKSCSFKLAGSSTMEPIMETTTADTVREPWNKGKLAGQKTPFKLKEIWAIRIRLQIAHRCRDLALFNLAVDSKLRACDLMALRVRDVCRGQIMASRALILQQKTSRPVQFEITEPARAAVAARIA